MKKINERMHNEIPSGKYLRKELNKQERVFVSEYLIDLDVERAALAAHYSKTMARTKAYQWVSNSKQNPKPYVYAAIQEAIKKREERTQIEADRVLQELAIVGFADMKDYVDIGEDGSVQLKPWDQMPEGASRAVSKVKEKKRIMTSAEGDGKEIIVEVTTEYSHYDKVKALELLGKHLGIFKEIVEIRTRYEEQLKSLWSKIETAQKKNVEIKIQGTNQVICVGGTLPGTKMIENKGRKGGNGGNGGNGSN